MSLAETLRRLPPAAVDYARSLFDHHWLEASWLYERREVLYTQGALLSADGWAELEDRTNAHVAALAKGGALVLDELEEKILEGDVGDLHTAVRLLCRTEQPRRFGALVGQIDWTEAARAWAVTDALTWDAPDSWQRLVGGLLCDEQVPDEARGPLARVAGMRGWALGEWLLWVLAQRRGDLEAVCWALGVLREQRALPELYRVISEGHAPAVRQAASIAALRFAPREVLAYLGQIVGQESWAAIPLAIGGGPQVWGVLSAAVKAQPTPEGMWAIGLFGYVGGIEMLLENVEDEECGAAAAEGLYLLTGAELFEEGYEVDPEAEGSVDEDEEPPGLLVCRLSRSKDVWSAWLDNHGARLNERLDARVRLGMTYCLLRLFAHASESSVSLDVRKWLTEELDIRYRLWARVWPRLLRDAQRAEAERGRGELRARPRYADGDWYLAGQPLRVRVDRHAPGISVYKRWS